MIYSPLTAISQDPTGWDDPTLVTESYDSTNRVVTVSGTGKLYWQGRLVHDLSLGNLVSAAHTATNGGWYLYYNGTAYVWSQTAWTFNLAMICFVQYVSATPSNSWALRECHSYMGWQTHRELHNTLGTARLSGGEITAIVPNSTTASERRPAVAATVLLDEDLQTTATALSAGTYTQAYIAASSVATFVTGAADIVPLNTAVPRWNNATTGALSDFTANQYGNVWLIAMPTTSDTQSLTYRYLWLTPQAVSTTLATINGETPAGLNLGTLTTLSAEFVFIARVMVRFVSANWQVISVTNLYGTRYQQTGSSSAPIDLSGYAALAGATFTGTVQEEAQHVDKHLTTITLPAAGYNSLITLSTGERRMKLPDGTELCDFVPVGPYDIFARLDFLLASSSTFAQSNFGYQGAAIATGTGTVVTGPVANHPGGAKVTSHASTANSGYAHSCDYGNGFVLGGASLVGKVAFQFTSASCEFNAGLMYLPTTVGFPVGMYLYGRSGVVGGKVVGSATSTTSTTSLSLTAGNWYEAIVVKIGTTYGFVLLNEDGSVFWADTISGGTDTFSSACQASFAGWHVGTPSGATLLAIAAHIHAGTPKAIRGYFHYAAYVSGSVTVPLY